MRISLFTGRLGDPRRVAHTKEAATIAADHGAEMLVLPGYSLGGESDYEVTLQRLADEAGVLILAEAWDTFLFRPDREPLGPFVQRFYRGANASHDAVSSVVEEFLRGDRIISVAGRDVGVLLCGENNVLRNVRRNDNEPQPRHPDVGWPFVYDVLVNPAHTSMWQWNLLHKRFAYLSQGGRTLLYCTNNTRSSWRTSLCVYQDGRRKAMGDCAAAGGLRTCVTESWRLVTVEVP